MPFSLSATQEIDALVSNKDAHGNPAPVQAATWKSSDVALATVTVSPTDANKATIRAVGPTGAVLITYEADADLGAGVVKIISTADGVVNPGQAIVSELTFSPPREQTPA